MRAKCLALTEDARVFVILAQGGNRLVRNWAVELHDAGLLKGRTIGILDDLESSYLSTDHALKARVGRARVPRRNRFEFVNRFR